MAMEVKSFTSPLRKLVQFFQRSRDAWKAKCQEAKRLCKQLSNQVRAVEKSRDQWKQQARQYQQQVQGLERELQDTKNTSAGECRRGVTAPRGAGI